MTVWLIVAWVLSGCVVVLTLGCWCCMYYCLLLDLRLFVIVCGLCFLDSVLRGLILRLIDSFAGYVVLFFVAFWLVVYGVCGIIVFACSSL